MLVELHGEINARTGEIASSRADWPCRRGCDHCCRNLAASPSLTAAEVDLLREGVARLPGAVREAVTARVRAWHTDARVCPFLDLEQGSCLVYEYRPVGCRTYGFYVDRDRGLYCSRIEEKVNSGEFADVVWGNAAGIEARLAGGGAFGFGDVI